METNIYALNLHEYAVIEELPTEKTVATRVPGGWIYTISNHNGDTASQSSIFVPYNDEFRSILTPGEVFK